MLTRLIVSGRRALGPCAAIVLLCGCAASAHGAALTYAPTSASVSAKAGGSAGFSLLVQAPKKVTVTATAPKVTAVLPNPIPAAWISALPAQATFGQAGRTFVITIFVPATAPPGTYTSGIGTHVINGNAQDGNGCLTTLTVVANVPPTGAFMYAPASPVTGQTVMFTDASTDPDGSVVAWAWNFGDGATSSQRNPTHQYADNDVYTVSLTVTDDTGSTGTVTDQVTVANQAPTAAFTYSPVNPTTADTVAFTDASTDPDGSIATWAWSFGDGATSDQRNPTHQYADDGTYAVTLTVTDNDGGIGSVSHSVSVANRPPTAAFSYTPATPSTADTISFTDTSGDPDGSVVSWAWSFGDGAISNQQNPTHQYADDGVYSVSLTVTDEDGAATGISQPLTVANQAPVAAFTYSPANPTTADTVAFSDASADLDGSIAGWAWDFGDGTTSSLQSPSHQYAEDGIYTVALTVTDDDGLTASTSQQFTVSGVPPVAELSHTPANPATDEIITFSDNSTDADGTIVVWAWDFGDGATSSDQNPTHQYTDNGVYAVSLTVTDNDGLTDTVTRDVTIANRPPTAAFGYAPGNPTTADPVAFSDGSSDPDGTVVAWAWDFGDGSTSTVRNATHRYLDDGVYSVTLIVTDDDGGTGSATESLTVGGRPPVAAFTYAPLNPTTGDTVVFTDGSSDTDGSVVRWEWDFGDGGTSSEQSPAHQYAGDGYYTVRISVVDDDGLSASCARVLRVGAPPAQAVMGSEDLSLLYTGGRMVTEGVSLRLSASAYDDFGANQTRNIAEMLSFSVLDAERQPVAQPEIVRANAAASTRAEATLPCGVYRIYADFPGNSRFGPTHLGPALVIVTSPPGHAAWGSLGAGQQEFALLLEPAVGETPMVCEFIYCDSVEERTIASTSVSSAQWDGDTWQVSGYCSADGVYGYEFSAQLTQTDDGRVFVLQVSNGLTVQSTLDPASMIR